MPIWPLVTQGMGPFSTGGSADYPAVGTVVLGTVYDFGGKTGTFVVPTTSEVQQGIGYGAGGTQYVGTLVQASDYPVTGNVVAQVSYDFGALVGTFTVPAANQVLAGVGYGAGGRQYVGTLQIPSFGGGASPDYTEDFLVWDWPEQVTYYPRLTQPVSVPPPAGIGVQNAYREVLDKATVQGSGGRVVRVQRVAWNLSQVQLGSVGPQGGRRDYGF